MILTASDENINRESENRLTVQQSDGVRVVCLDGIQVYVIDLSDATHCGGWLWSCI